MPRPRRVEQPAHHGDGVVDIDEIAPLLAVGDTVAVRLEQMHGLPRLGVVETLGDEAHHLALVVFVGPKTLKNFRPAHCGGSVALRGAVDHREVEQVFAPAVEIHRPEPVERRDRPSSEKPLSPSP